LSWLKRKSKQCPIKRLRWQLETPTKFSKFHL